MSEWKQSSFLPEKPLGVAMIVCDRVITEEGTQNKTIVSTFNQITAKRYPCFYSRLAVYVALTNGSGEKKVNLRFRNNSGDEPLFEMGGTVKFESPNSVVELIFNVRNLSLPEPGLYTFEIFADGEYIFEVKFNAVRETNQLQ